MKKANKFINVVDDNTTEENTNVQNNNTNTNNRPQNVDGFIIDSNINTNGKEDVNKKNKQEYETLMRESSSNYDMFFDKNSWIVRFFKYILLVIALTGVIYYAIIYFAN